MRRKIITSLICLPLIMTWSCGEWKNTIKNKNWSKNPVLLKDSEKMNLSQYRFRNNTDSIVAKYSNYDNRFIFKYHVKDNTTFKKKRELRLEEVYFSIENGSKAFIGKSNIQGEVKLFYTLDKYNNLTIENLPNAPQPIILTPTIKKYPKDKNIEAGWYTTSVMDSLVLAFDDGILKEYLFVKGGTEVLNYHSFGEYKVHQTHTYWNNILEEQESYFTVDEEEFKYIRHYYWIEDDTLTIKWGNPINKTIKYKHLK